MSKCQANTNTPDYNDNDTLCHCMSIKRSEVTPILQNKQINHLDDIISRSGVGSVCMGCHPLLQEMIGEDIWTPVQISSITQVSNDALAFRFKPKFGAFHPAKAGQHIVVQAYIDGVWELRRYTLTTAAEETEYREITIQRDPTGKVSSWFHQISESEKLIRISQPAGEATPDLIGVKRLICLVGGVGITPAISFIRTIYARPERARQIFLYHSVLNKERLILKEELDALSDQNNQIHVNYRLTDKDGFISQKDINDLVIGFPNCDFYVCGPPAYSEAVLSYLEEADVKNDSITIEHFSSPETKDVNQSKTYFYLGLILFSLFLFQELFQLKMPWLENLQMQENYKIYSGLFAVLYILSQFIMPYNKSCETPHTSATNYQQHKIRGALAPLIFFIHSTQFGVAYLFMLSLSYFGNFLLGLLNHERIQNPIKRIKYFKFWLPLHIILSIISVTMIGFHIYVVTSY